jgi:hypothetical protein
MQKKKKNVGYGMESYKETAIFCVDEKEERERCNDTRIVKDN